MYCILNEDPCARILQDDTGYRDLGQVSVLEEDSYIDTQSYFADQRSESNHSPETAITTPKSEETCSCNEKETQVSLNDGNDISGSEKQKRENHCSQAEHNGPLLN